jgi:hypothetical protein
VQVGQRPPPNRLIIAVIAHAGWNNDSNATARDSLSVTSGVVNRVIGISDDLTAAVLSLRQEIELEAGIGEAQGSPRDDAVRDGEFPPPPAPGSSSLCGAWVRGTIR